MKELEQAQGRILAALARIGASADWIEAKQGNAATAPETGALEEALAQNARLEARIAELENAPAPVAPVTEPAPEGVSSREALEALAQMEEEIGRLREVNEQLRANNRALREAHEAAGAELLAEGVLAELESLRADHAAARAEAASILAVLKPLVSEELDGKGEA